MFKFYSHAIVEVKLTTTSIKPKPTMSNYLIGSSIIQSILPTIVNDNIDVAIFFAILSYVLFLINWLVTTDWVEKLHLFSGATCAIGGE